MIDQIGKGRTWETGNLEKPLGRGVNFQIEVESIGPILKSLRDNNYSIFLEPEEKWYRKGDKLQGVKQFLVQDPGLSTKICRITRNKEGLIYR